LRGYSKFLKEAVSIGMVLQDKKEITSCSRGVKHGNFRTSNIASPAHNTQGKELALSSLDGSNPINGSTSVERSFYIWS